MKFPSRLQACCNPQRIALTAFFLAGFYYLWFVITYGLTDVCVYDEQFYRRFGYYLSWLDFPGSTSLADFFDKIRQFGERAMLSGGTHSHGPLQFILWNLYLSGVIRDHFPIIPKVTAFGMQFVPACLAMAYAWLLGRQLESRRFAYIFAAAFVLSPVMRLIARWDTIYILLMVLMHLMVFYHWTAFIRDSERPFNRLMAPLSLGIYLTTGLDWAPTCFFLVFYLGLCKKVKIALRNRYMIIPAVIFGTQLMFLLYIYAVDSNYAHGHERWKVLLVSAPFKKLFYYDSFKPASKMTLTLVRGYLLSGYGIGWFVAFVVALCVVFRAAKKVLADTAVTLEIRRNFQIALSCWLLLLSYPVLSNSLQMGYLPTSFSLLLPTIFLATLPVARETRFAVWDLAKSAVFLGFMVLPQPLTTSLKLDMSSFTLPFHQSYFATDIKLMDPFNTDRRLYAVAEYLILERPDLLGADKRAILPNVSGDMHAYNPAFLRFLTAGRYEYINLALDDAFFPNKKNMPGALISFMRLKGWDDSRSSMLRHFNWVVLPTEGITSIPGWPLWNMHAKYWESLLHDPNVDWIGRFVNPTGAKGKEMFLGEFRPGNAGKNRDIGNAPVYEVEPLAKRYNEKYNRVSFLKRNIDLEIRNW